MKATLQEQATLNFYQWEYRGRGYYLSDEPSEIEPPYRPFSYFELDSSHTFDDGRVPNIFKRVANFLTPSKDVLEQENEEFNVPPLEGDIELSCFEIRFDSGEDINVDRSRELLHLLALTEYPVSFELYATHESIKAQWVCRVEDQHRVESHLKAYFPNMKVSIGNAHDLAFDIKEDAGIIDFGLQDEFVRPIHSTSSVIIDPLTSLIGMMENIQDGELVLIQCIFKGVSAPWARDIVRSVSDGQGGSFFSDSPEMLQCGIEKASSPLFSVILRLVVEGADRNRSNYLGNELSRNVISVSKSAHNELIPLSNEGYPYVEHIYNVYHRTSNRLGMILNSNELLTFAHYPNRTVVSSKLSPQTGKTKRLPDFCVNQKYDFGVNVHDREENFVTMNDEQRLRHTHIIGATGVGKSTLIANMMIEDMNAGNGCALFDPHGDIVEDVLLRVPEHRKDDVVIIDPSDTEFPIGFNLLHASTEPEKIVLSSDLVSAFKRMSTAWGDNMTAVLANAINAFLEHTEGGTLIELKRFLIEEKFRNQYLNGIEDRSILYYWEHEYPLVKKGIAPLLTRIDTFLRPKIVRYMLAQKKGVDFKTCLDENKILLIKLSQGLIGAENSYLLGTLFLSKLNQAALSRQTLSKSERSPFYIYLDEFQNFITPSISNILSGSRKYGLGLTLAHQELAQIDNPQVLNSIISNPYTRFCFRLGDADAKKLETGFSHFEGNDLQSLGIGEAIMRVGGAMYDFNIKTYPFSEIDREESEKNKEHIIQSTRSQFTQKKADVVELLNSLLPIKKDDSEKPVSKNPKSKESIDVEVYDKEEHTLAESKNSLEEQKKAFLQREEEKEKIQKHRNLQHLIRTMALQRDYVASLEKETTSGGRVDVALVKDKLRIAVEVAVTNTAENEVKNIEKCIAENYDLIFVISENEPHLMKIKTLTKKTLKTAQFKKVSFIQPTEIASHLDGLEQNQEQPIKRVRGYRVKTKIKEVPSSRNEGKSKSLKDIILNSRKKKK